MSLTTAAVGGGTGGLPLLASGVIAVVRAPEATRLRAVARALAAGGVGAVEITLTTPGAIATMALLLVPGAVGDRGDRAGRRQRDFPRVHCSIGRAYV